MKVSTTVNPYDALQCILEINYADASSNTFNDATYSTPIAYTESPIITLVPKASNNLTDFQQEVNFNLQITTISIQANYTIEIYTSEERSVLELTQAQVDSLGNSVIAASWNNVFHYKYQDLASPTIITKYAYSSIS